MAKIFARASTGGDWFDEEAEAECARSFVTSTLVVNLDGVEYRLEWRSNGTRDVVRVLDGARMGCMSRVYRALAA
jgi:hypothetical protein